MKGEVGADGARKGWNGNGAETAFMERTGTALAATGHSAGAGGDPDPAAVEGGGAAFIAVHAVFAGADRGGGVPETGALAAKKAGLEAADRRPSH